MSGGAPSDPWIGRTIAGRFAIVKRLGEGGGGRVYVAEQAIGKAKRPVALKMLLPEHASNPDMIERFSRECETVSVIEHVNVVRLYDFGETDGALYIAMELVAGCSLGALIAEEGALAPRRALDLFAQICRGVSAAHDRDIVHRDLKPDNLMVVQREDEPELVKVLDFGIAKAVGSSARGARPLTQLGAVIGSPAYMSPEQFVGGAIDVRTDVYALGVVAYEMLTGVLPFDAHDIHGWAAQHIGATPRSFDATAAGQRVAEPVRRVIERAMAKNPADRPPTVRALLRELTDAPRRPDPRVPAPLVLPAARPRPRRTRAATIARWALVAVAATGAGSVAALAAASSPRVASYVGTQPPPAQPPVHATPAVAKQAEADAAPVVVIQPVAPLPPVASAKPPPPKLDVTGCERALRAGTCEDARAGQRTCPDAAGAIHHRAHERADELCGVADHHRSAARL